MATGLELAEHELSRSKATNEEAEHIANERIAREAAEKTATAETTLKRSALELATGLELAQHELSKSTKKMTSLESNKLKQTALELATGIELADYKKTHPESLVTQLTNFLKQDKNVISYENFWGIFLILINLILFILLVTFVGQKKGYDNGIGYNTKGNTKQRADVAFTICFVFFLVFSGMFYFNYIKIKTVVPGLDAAANAALAAAIAARATVPGATGAIIAAFKSAYEFEYSQALTNGIDVVKAKANALTAAVAAVKHTDLQLSIFEPYRTHPQTWDDPLKIIFEFLPELGILTIIGLIIAFWALGSNTGLNKDTTLGLNITIGIIGVIIVAIILFFRGRAWGAANAAGAIKRTGDAARAGVTGDNFKALIIRLAPLALLTIIGLIIAFWAMGSKSGVDSGDRTNLTISILTIIGFLILVGAIYSSPDIQNWIIKYSSMFFGSSCILFLLILILYATNHFGNKTKGNDAAMGLFFAIFVICIIGWLIAYNKNFNNIKTTINVDAGKNMLSYIYSGISLTLFCLFYVVICGMLRTEDSIKSSVSFIVTSLNILLVGIMLVNNFSFTTADWVSKITMVISVIVIIGLLVGVFDITALLINIFAFGLLALTGYGFKGLWAWFNKANISGDVNQLTTLPTDPITIGLLVAIFIAIIIGIFMLVFYPKKPENSPNNPDMAYKNIMIIIYVLISMIIVGILFYGYQNISKLPSIVGSGMSYIMKLMYSLIGIILYMVFMSYFYGYGGLLTIFAKKNKDGTYDSSIDPATNKPVNPASLNKTVADLNKSKNTAMIVLAPITIAMGIYILYRGYKVEGATMDKIFDTFKKVILFIFGIIFFIHVWTLDPKQSTFHDTIRSYFSGNMLVVDIFIAIFGIIYVIMGMAKEFVGPNVSVEPKALTDPEKSGPIKLIAYVILYIIFIIVISVGLSTNYFTATNNSDTKVNASQTGASQARAGGAIFFIIIVSIVWLYFTYFELVKLDLIPENITKLEWTKTYDYFRKLSMVVAGMIISSLIIYVLVTSINGLTNKNKKKSEQGTIPFIVNLLTILVILGILYKILKVGSNPKVNQTYHLALDVIFYIPCLFITLYNNLPSMGKVNLPSMGKVNAPAMPNANDFTQLAYIKILLGVIALYIVYFYFFSFSHIYNNQNGTVILRDPVALKKLTTLSDYLKLNKLDENSKETTGTDKSSEQGSINKFNYHYGMSFWVYLDSVNESQIDKYLTILNYGDKPKVEYNPSKNIMRVTVASNDDSTNADDRNAEPRIIYTLNNVLLQKWNNIIFNYSGGTVDIFYNGELVASTLNVAPYMSYDALVSGQDNGITGGICNVTYFTKSMTTKQIYYLYNILKDTSPPVMYDAKQTINNIKNNKKIQFV